MAKTMCIRVVLLTFVKSCWLQKSFSLSFYSSLAGQEHGKEHVQLLFHLSQGYKYIYIYMYIYIYIYIYIVTWSIFLLSFWCLGRDFKRKGVFGWLCFILIKSCFNSQGKHLKLQLFHVLLY